ncbi:hypothetical protein HK104_011290 [Borealophlyctis nickersoniae]|nr:hypothetical protein HK104_011290 [Borealophlyctis nickersoniae]
MGARKGKGGSGTASPAPVAAALTDPSAVLKGVESPEGIIVAALTTALDAVKAGVDASQRRMVEDTDKRLESLFERLAAKQLQPPVLAQLLTLANALNARDFPTANATVMSLMTTSFDQEGKWLLGVKRLVELYQRV